MNVTGDLVSLFFSSHSFVFLFLWLRLPIVLTAGIKISINFTKEFQMNFAFCSMNRIPLLFLIDHFVFSFSRLPSP